MLRESDADQRLASFQDGKYMTTPIMLRHLGADVLSGFMDAVTELNLTLYPAQEEAILEILDGKNLILSTPTGSGKSLVAIAMHFKSLAQNRRSFYTSPIKALVSEKFFHLCDLFGADKVGMLTGDASINRDAPIICCTAEILANMGVGEGENARVDDVIMDEFHYYSDPDRGSAWQIPLLTMPQCRYLLMSATLGDMRHIKSCLELLTHTEVAEISSMERPVPLDFSYVETPLQETIYELVCEHKFPIYVVNFTQRECGEVAQDTMSVNLCTKQEKEELKEAIGTFRFDTSYGNDIKRFLLHGVGLHHAGLLPKYRLLVERLAQSGKLKVIFGTDTLGVGVNIPIRTVLFTKLCKFDGKKTGILSSRDFKQISGRAGRKGFDDAGSVVCQAPEHVIENRRMENRHEVSKQKKKFVKKQPPTKNYVPWNEATFHKLIEQPPEPLTSQFQVTHALIISSLQSHEDGYRRVIELVEKCHESDRNKKALRIHAAQLCRSLLNAEIILVAKNQMNRPTLVVNSNFQNDFSLNHTLSVFLVDTLPTLDINDSEYALNVLSMVESVLESPKVILFSQVDKLKQEKLSELKAGGVDYEDRLEQLDKVEHPKPLGDFIYAEFNAFAKKHPWVGKNNILPKSIARDIFEKCATFNQYVSEYGLKRSEGVLLRYISQSYKALTQTVPDTFKTDEVHDIVAFFRVLLGRVDTSLIEEWGNLLKPSSPTEQIAPRQAPIFDPDQNPKAFKARIRSELHTLLKALSLKDYDEAALLIQQNPDDLWDATRFENSLADFYNEHQGIVFGSPQRQPQYTTFRKLNPVIWEAQQIIVDGEDSNDWYIEVLIEIRPDLDENATLIKLQSIRC